MKEITIERLFVNSDFELNEGSLFFDKKICFVECLDSENNKHRFYINKNTQIFIKRINEDLFNEYFILKIKTNDGNVLNVLKVSISLLETLEEIKGKYKREKYIEYEFFQDEKEITLENLFGDIRGKARKETQITSKDGKIFYEKECVYIKNVKDNVAYKWFLNSYTKIDYKEKDVERKVFQVKITTLDNHVINIENVPYGVLLELVVARNFYQKKYKKDFEIIKNENGNKRRFWIHLDELLGLSNKLN